ncbi:MAG: NADH-quinone oxidoreductase subunit J [Prevotella sp.]|jgi:NADH-quinone oxidoreductase subunit J
MDKIIIFGILAVIILGSAVLCVSTKRIMRAATFLLFVLFGVAGLYFLMGYTFLGAAQISVYAGGITMMYVFAIQLVSKRTLQGLIERFKGTRVGSGLLISVLGLLTVGAVLMKNQFINNIVTGDIQELPMEKIGQAMLGADKYQYVLPFEFISVFLLACIIGGILIARKEDKK